MAESDEQEASSSTSQVLTTNLSDLSRDECKIIIDEMSNKLYNLHVSLKSLTKENSRIKGSIRFKREAPFHEKMDILLYQFMVRNFI